MGLIALATAKIRSEGNAEIRDNSQEAALANPGDTTTIHGILMMLHRDATGQTFASATTTTAVRTYGDHSHIHDFTSATQVEENLYKLANKWANETDTLQTTIMPSHPTRDGTDCDCELAPFAEAAKITKPRRHQYKFRHTEIQDESCPRQRENLYETLMSAPAKTEPLCVITPTREAENHLRTLTKLGPKNLREKLNEEAGHTCAEEGSYNVRTLPIRRVHRPNATTMIECALHCQFTERCTDWIFDTEGPPRCWTVDTRHLRPEFNRRPNGPFVTGSKDCLPCALKRTIMINDTEGLSSANEQCRVDTSTGWQATTKCACSQRETLNKFGTLLNKTVQVARTNTIEKRKGTNAANFQLVMAKILRELRTTRGGLRGLEKVLLDQSSGTNVTPMVDRFKQLVGQNTQIRAIVTPIVKLLTPDRWPKAETTVQRGKQSTRYDPSTTELGVNLPKLGAGTHASSREVWGKLHITKTFLETAEEQKQRVLNLQTGVPGYNKIHTDPSTEIEQNAKALVVTVDAGEEAAQLAVFPHKGTAEAKRITFIPLPTTITANQETRKGMQGRWTSPSHYNRQHPYPTISEQCAQDIITRRGTATNCLPAAGTETLTEYMEVTLEHRGNTIRLVRIAKSSTTPRKIAVECGKALHKINAVGTLLLAMGNACIPKDEQGIPFTRRIANNGNKTNDEFKLIYQGKIRQEEEDMDETDIVQLTTGAIILLIVAVTAAWLCRATKKGQATITEQATDPVELEYIHPEAGTPELERKDD